jgi:tetratricopeptide (TPR) repeat protein
MQDGGYFVRTDGSDGELQDFEIAYTFGAVPLQQYLIEFPDGRYQALSICWDTRPAEEGGQRWFHLYPDAAIDHDDELHWTGVNQNWNFMCAECHSTDLKKRFLANENRFDTTFEEINVSCEACHGPGSLHVEWADAVALRMTPPYDNGHMGLVVRLEDPGRGTWIVSPETGSGTRLAPPVETQEMETCARCHSRRGLIWEEYEFGRPLLDTHRLALLEEGLYHADGQIEEEVYVHGSYLQSKMFQKGVTCSDCHDPHSLEMHFPDDSVCVRCHSREKFATQEHHFHKPDTKGAFCVDCHMPPKNYMVVDPRHDHSLRIPRPDLSLALGTPNACNDCHNDKSVQWSMDWIVKWYGPDRRQERHYGEALHAAREGLMGAEQALIELIENEEAPVIARATALTLLPSYLTAGSLPVLERALGSQDPLMRRAAVGATEALEDNSRLSLVYPSLHDPVRAVRFEAAARLASVPRDRLSSPQRTALQNVLAEYRESLRINADRPESHLNLAVLHLNSGDLDKAEESYLKAVEVDPLFPSTYINLADLYRMQGRDAEGERLLRRALELYPESGDIRHARGLSLVRLQRPVEAREELRLASEAIPESARYAYVYGVALLDSGEPQKGLEVLEEAHESHPTDRELLVGLVSIHRSNGNMDTALDYARKLQALVPQDPNVQRMVQELEASGS